jgi:type VI secretion system (T6SS) effector TldE1-like protein
MSHPEIQSIHDKLATISETLAAHLAREDEWQRSVEQRLTAHLEKHRLMRSRVTGLVFTLIGSAVDCHRLLGQGPYPPGEVDMFSYSQRTGKLTHPQLGLLATGYSGFPPHTNKPEDETLHDLGPIPRGSWHITGEVENSHDGLALRLEPQPGTDTHGRGGFLVHGDMGDPAQRGQASHGCVIVRGSSAPRCSATRSDSAMMSSW